MIATLQSREPNGLDPRIEVACGKAVMRHAPRAERRKKIYRDFQGSEVGTAMGGKSKLSRVGGLLTATYSHELLASIFPAPEKMREPIQSSLCAGPGFGRVHGHEDQVSPKLTFQAQ